MIAWRKKPKMRASMRRSVQRNWCKRAAAVIAKALDCPDRPWFRLRVRGLR